MSPNTRATRLPKSFPTTLNGPPFQGLDHSCYVVSHRLKRDPCARARTLARTPEVDAHHPVTTLSKCPRQTIQVIHGQGSTRQQNDRFTFASAEVLDVGVGELDDPFFYAARRCRCLCGSFSGQKGERYHACEDSD